MIQINKKANMDYNKSILTQSRKNPEIAGLKRALGAGGIGAILGALTSRLISDKPSDMALGALVGGLIGGIPGYISGKKDTKAENSKILFLRKNLGIMTPGDFEIYLKYPELLKAHTLLKQSAAKTNLVKNILPLLGGGTLGGLAGYHVMPEIGGYKDVEPSRRIGAFLSSIEGAIAAAYLKRHGLRRVIDQISKNPKITASVGAGLAGAELIPVFHSVATRAREAATEQANAAKIMSIPHNVQNFFSNPVTQSALAGAGVAGLAALASGLLRRKSEKEIKENKTRTNLVVSDFLKYVVPFMAAGGLLSLSQMKNKNNY